MSRVAYARVVAFLPIFFPCFGYLLPDAARGTWLAWMRGAFGVLLFASWAVGIQYLVCVVIALWWLRGRRITSYWYVACFAPLIFGVVVSISLAGTTILSASWPILVERVAPGALALGLVTIAIGYLYVLLAAAGYLLLDAAGAFTEVPPNLRLQRPASHET